LAIDYYVASLFGEVLSMVLIPVGIAYVIAKLRYGRKKHD